MEIAFSSRNLSNALPKKILRRPLLLASCISLAIVAWLGLTSYQFMFDQPLDQEKISAHRLRVNSKQLTKLQSDIAAYQAPTTPGVVKPDLIAPATKETN